MAAPHENVLITSNPEEILKAQAENIANQTMPQSPSAEPLKTDANPEQTVSNNTE